MARRPLSWSGDQWCIRDKVVSAGPPSCMSSAYAFQQMIFCVKWLSFPQCVDCRKNSNFNCPKTKRDTREGKFGCTSSYLLLRRNVWLWQCSPKWRKLMKKNLTSWFGPLFNIHCGRHNNSSCHFIEPRDLSMCNCPVVVASSWLVLPSVSYTFVVFGWVSNSWFKIVVANCHIFWSNLSFRLVWSHLFMSPHRLSS
jgi:hypothetical protein